MNPLPAALFRNWIANFFVGLILLVASSVLFRLMLLESSEYVALKILIGWVKLAYRFLYGNRSKQVDMRNLLVCISGILFNFIDFNLRDTGLSISVGNFTSQLNKYLLVGITLCYENISQVGLRVERSCDFYRETVKFRNMKYADVCSIMFQKGF